MPKSSCGCYHIWVKAQTGTALFRRTVCYETRSSANKLLQRGGSTGDRTSKPLTLMRIGAGRMPVKKPATVLECDPATCPCRCNWAVAQRFAYLQQAESSVVLLSDAKTA